MGLFNNLKFPAWTMQQLNLDWLLEKFKRIENYMPDGGESGDILRNNGSGAEWQSPDDLFEDSGWIDITGTSVHFRKKNGYVTVLFDSSATTVFHGGSDWETVATLTPNLRPEKYVFFYLGAGGHSNDIKGEGYIGPDGAIGVYFPEQCTNIGGYVIYPV